jgi:phosphoribosylanthranilate isomerase
VRPPEIEVKICGLCRPQDAAAARDAGANYLGVLLAPGHPRTRTIPEALEILAAGEGKAGGPRKVGIFVDGSAREIVAAAQTLRLDVVQLHGSEPPELLEHLRSSLPGVEIWKAVRVRNGESVQDASERYAASAAGLLLDGWSETAAGGAGVAFSWADVTAARARIPRELKLIVAGGLTPATVAQAIRALRPDCVDVSSGVESERGVKDARRIAAFIEAARGA